MFKQFNRKNPDGEPRTGIVSNIPEIREFKTGREKTVFNLTGKSGRTVTCVYWGISLLEKDENVMVFGYEKNDVYIVNRIIRNYSS